MKKDGVTDPFAETPDEPDESDNPVSQPEQSDEAGSQSSQTGQSNSSVIPGNQTTGNTSAEASSDSGNTRQYDQSNLPRILTRDTVKADRDHVHQLFVYDDTHQSEKEARRELEDRLGEDIYKLDVREAIYLAGMQNLDDAEAVLREWGADI